jgi:C4-dicarboxylate transporter DctQ subunit
MHSRAAAASSHRGVPCLEILMNALFLWLRKAAEAIGALLMLALFATFLLQIFSRYAMNSPFGWTLELCLLLWVWIVFFGAAFIVRRSDHITFDLLYMAVPSGPRRVLAIFSSLAIAGLLAWSFLPTWDWIDFLRIKRSATLRIPMRDIFSVYMVFLAAVIIACLWRAVSIARHGFSADENEGAAP